MEQTLTKHEQLLSWMDPDSYEQLSWISSYLTKKGLRELPGSQVRIAGNITQLRQLFKDNLHHALTRELLRSMRAAWHQKQYRERNGRQASFQLPERVLKELDQISRSRRQSKTQTLRQIIHDARKKDQRDRQRSKEKIKKLEGNLKKLHEEKLNAEAMRNRLINTLSRELANEILHSCRYEELIDSMEIEAIKNIKNSRINELARKKAEAIEKSLWEIRTIRPTLKSISSHLESLQRKID